ncbi:MAG: helix-hairpin-helix domain-containing protein [Chthoniobacterales bacterium]|nr:helix-hairpin-helix domain-containing protein [Chthoniobacterales bacterium]
MLKLPGDGDSFYVEILRNGNPEKLLVRLYFADAPECDAGMEADRRRIVEQMRYFGVQTPQIVLNFGRLARDRREQLLAEPFTVHTSFARAPGRSGAIRVYAMITTSKNQDLAAILIREGLARAQGVARATPDEISAEEYATQMADLEAGAMLSRKGIWAESNPDLLVEGRKEWREELRKLQELFEPKFQPKIDLNEATAWELRALPGLGETLAQRIIQGRPYNSVDELVRIRGISRDKLESWRSRLTVGNQTTTAN